MVRLATKLSRSWGYGSRGGLLARGWLLHLVAGSGRSMMRSWHRKLQQLRRLLLGGLGLPVLLLLLV